MSGIRDEMAYPQNGRFSEIPLRGGIFDAAEPLHLLLLSQPG